MNGYLRQSTASQTRTVGVFVDDTDFKSLENGLTIANTDIKLKKNGATAVNKNSGGGTSDVNGEYAVTFDATDTNTVGELAVSIKVAGALVVWDKFIVLEEAAYDLLFASGASPANKIAAHTWRITAANIEADSTADTIVNGTPSAFNVICANGLQYDVVSSDIVFKNGAGTSIGKRAITVNANTQIVTIAKMVAS